jgi:hypothetical protein
VIPIELDKPRNLHYDFAALRDLEAQMNGEPLGEILRKVTQGGITATAAIVFCGLKHEDKALTPRLLDKMLAHYMAGGSAKRRELFDKVSEALVQAKVFGDDDAEEATNGNGAGPKNG